MDDKSDWYSGSILATALGISFALIGSVGLSIVITYWLNKKCIKPKVISKGSNTDYLTAGEKQLDKRHWPEIELTMLKNNVERPPLNAPKDF